LLTLSLVSGEVLYCVIYDPSVASIQILGSKYIAHDISRL